MEKHDGVGILFFVWGPLLGSRVRTGVTDGRTSWMSKSLVLCLMMKKHTSSSTRFPLGEQLQLVRTLRVFQEMLTQE